MTLDQCLRASVQVADRERGETLVPQGGLSVSLLPEVVSSPVASNKWMFHGWWGRAASPFMEPRIAQCAQGEGWLPAGDQGQLTAGSDVSVALSVHQCVNQLTDKQVMNTLLVMWER